MVCPKPERYSRDATGVGMISNDANVVLESVPKHASKYSISGR